MPHFTIEYSANLDERVEEARRRQLLVVANDDDLLTTSYRAHCIYWLHLTRFIEDNEIDGARRVVVFRGPTDSDDRVAILTVPRLKKVGRLDHWAPPYVDSPELFAGAV